MNPDTDDPVVSPPETAPVDGMTADDGTIASDDTTAGDGDAQDVDAQSGEQPSCDPVSDCMRTERVARDASRLRLERRVFLTLLVLMTLLFGYVLKPFFGPILWACVLALMFYPIQKRLCRVMRGRQTLAALATLLISVLVCVVPLIVVGKAFYDQVMSVYQQYQNGSIDVSRYVELVNEKLPAIHEFLHRFGVDSADISAQLSKWISAIGGFVAGNAVNAVQGTAKFAAALVIMIYLSFFMLRDGSRLTCVLMKAIPIGDRRESMLFSKFAQMVHAMIRGTLVIAVVQGSLGGLIFWALGSGAPVLWGVVMSVTSMIPVLGTWIVWLPFAIYLVLTGAWVKGIIMALFGFFVIGLIDNFLRPRLVGRETRVPDWVVLLSTLGGLVVFGFSGFIIGPVVAALFLTFWEIFEKDFS
ncbi:AI-2E family transporter [Myxococcota bacterium]|nr:AI-2E family transporter [Myxococcota bacterium]